MRRAWSSDAWDGILWFVQQIRYEQKNHQKINVLLCGSDEKTPQNLVLTQPGDASAEGSMRVGLCVHACMSGLSVVTAVPVLHIHVSLPFCLCVSFFSPFFLSASLSPVHLSLLDSSHYCLGTSSACPAKARHWNGIWERESVWEIVNEEREEDADREAERGRKRRERERVREKWTDVEEKEGINEKRIKSQTHREGWCSIIKTT